jgi:hypothetical protein
MITGKAALFMGLNAIRFLSILTLILVFASSIVTMVNDIHAVQRGVTSVMVPVNATGSPIDDDLVDCDYLEGSTVPNQPAGAFWAILNRLFIIFQCILLILSEIGWPSSFFQNYLPVLGPDFGVFILGCIQILIGAAVLSHHVDMFAIVSAFFLFAVGCLNLIAGMIFRSSIKSKRSITSWRERGPILGKSFTVVAHPGPASSMFSEKQDTGFSNYSPKSQMRPFKISNPIVTQNTAPSYEPAPAASHGLSHSNSTSTSNSTSPRASPFTRGYGFGRQSEKAAAVEGYYVQPPRDTLPRYAGSVRSGVSESEYSHHPHGSDRSFSPKPARSQSPSLPIQDPPHDNRI